MLKIESINISGFRSIQSGYYSFRDVNYVTGPNGCGKSSIFDAIQLALLGYLPGHSKKNADIFKNASGMTMNVTLTLVSTEGGNVQISRTWTLKGSSVSCTTNTIPEGFEPEHVIGNLELPIFNFSDILGMSANDQKKWFLSMLPEPADGVDVPDRIHTNLAEFELIPKEYVSETEQSILKEYNDHEGASIRSKLVGLYDWLKGELSFKKDSLKRVEKTISTLVYHDDVETSDTEALKAKIQAANDTKLRIVQYREQKAAYDNYMKQAESIRSIEEQYGFDKVKDISEVARVIEINEQAAALDKEYKETQSSYSEITDNLNAGRDTVSNLAGKLMTVKNKIRDLKSSVSGSGVCPYTRSRCDVIQAKLEEIQKSIDALEDEQDELNKQHKAATESVVKLTKQSREISDRRIQIQSEKSKLSTEFMQINNAYDKYQSHSAAIPKITVYEPVETEEQCNATIREAQDTLIKIEANKRYTELIDKLTSEKSKTEFEIQMIKSLIDLVGPNGLQNEIADLPFKEFGANMDKYLSVFFSGQNVHAAFNLVAKSNTFSFGINRNDRYIPYSCLSGGERCKYLTAFMASIISESNSSLKLLMIDEMLYHLDDESTKTLLESLYKVDNMQIILAGIRPLDAPGVQIIRP